MSTNEDPKEPAMQAGSQPPADSRPADQIAPEAGLETSSAGSLATPFETLPGLPSREEMQRMILAELAKVVEPPTLMQRLAQRVQRAVEALGAFVWRAAKGA